MKHSTFVGLSFAAALSAASVTSLANDGFPDAGSVSIQSFQTAGSGCPPGTVVANVSPDNKALTFLFDSYVLETNGSSQLVQKNCVINMSLSAPPGWRYALFSIDYRGFADLEAGVTATQQTEYAFGVSGQKRIGSMELKGPGAIDYAERSVGVISELAWSDCGNSGGPDVLTISTTATLNSRAQPTTQEIALASAGARYSETTLAGPVFSMDLVRKDSAAACVINRSFGIKGNKVWVDKGCRGLFRVAWQDPNVGGGGQGLLTVDSMDAQLYEPGQIYGVAWQRCGDGRWIQANGNKDCKRVCRDAGLQLGRDPFGAECTSGEARPSTAAGTIKYNMGCWSGTGCQAQGDLKTDNIGLFCYQPGQKRDADRTDRVMGCYCKQ